jgi:carboxyl-terminal processing protease
MNLYGKMKRAIALLLAVALLLTSIPTALGASLEQEEEVRGLLEQYHLSKPSNTDLADKPIEEMVESLHDPYTQYYDDQQWKTLNAELEQTFVGIGIYLAENKGKVYVEDVIADSPAMSAGLLAGDEFVAADGVDLTGKTMAEVQQTLRGEEGTVVSLTVSRQGKAMKFRITRKSVHIPVVTSRLLDKGIGYLALSAFTSESGKEVKSELEKLEKSGLDALVLDLRNNGGGYVNAAQEIAGLFIEKGVLAHLRDNTGADSPLDVKGTSKPYSVVLLVNGNSASASELLSGALRDYGIATLVGTRTFGKGVVQSLHPLQSGGMLKLTVQEYYTPLGKKVDKTGLIPELVLNGAAEQLIGAYRLAGGGQVSVTAREGILTVNGVRMAQSGAIVKDKQAWQINIKLAASIVGAKLTYDAKSRAYKLDRAKQTVTIKTNDPRLTLKDGSASLDVKTLKKLFSGVTYSVSGDTLKLSAKSP